MTEEDPKPAGKWARFRNWLGHLHFRLVTIEDTPHSIALGVAIGIFFGFTPLWSLKTLLSIAVAWLCKSNKIAAAISVQLHDLILPFMPAIYLWEYKVGFWSLTGHLPARFSLRTLSLREYIQWETFFTVGRPLLIGSVIIGLPSAAIIYFICRGLVTSHRASRKEEERV
ncbi:MAG: DUF2062 domain-containing protein [Chthoniobacterales bacterium]